MNLTDNSRGGTFCLSNASLAIGSTATGISIAAPNGAGVDYAINGVSYHKADAATAAITVHPAQTADTTCLYGIYLNSSGTVSSVQAIEVTTASLTAKESVLKLPIAVADTCLIGMLCVVTVAVTFTSGTDDLDASGVTTTYQENMLLQPEPLTAKF